MRRASLALILLLPCFGCSTSDPVGLPVDPDGGSTPMDMGMMADRAIQDAIAIDMVAPPPDGGQIDGEVNDGGTISEPCTTVHTRATPAAVPTTDQVTAAYGGEVTYLAWADENGVHQCTIGTTGEFEGALTPVETPEVEMEAVVSLRAGGTTWIAYGAQDQPIRVYQAHRPSETLTILNGENSTIVGRPHLAEAAGSIMVIGQTPSGTLAWQIIPSDFSDRQVYYEDTAGFGWPNSVGTIQGGVYLRFGTEGQCVLVGDVDWVPVGTLPCEEGVGELVSDGQRSVLWNTKQRGNEEFLFVSSLTDREVEGVALGKALTSAELAMGIYRGQKPLIGIRSAPIPQGRVGEAQLILVGPSGIWTSYETWGQWPSSDARAISYADLPERAQEGRCGDEGDAPCQTDDDCSEEDTPLCHGNAEARHALVFRFQTYGRPEIDFIPLGLPTFSFVGSIFEEASVCSPIPEICDGIDQDCDGFVDDGICCPVPENGVLKVDFTTDGPIDQFVLGDEENHNAFLLSYRQTGDDGRSFWRTKRMKYVETDDVRTSLEEEYVRDCNQPGDMGRCGGDLSDPRSRCRTDADCPANRPRCEGLQPIRCKRRVCEEDETPATDQCDTSTFDNSVSTLRYAADAAHIIGIGGTRAFIAKTPPEHPTPNRWAVHWFHWTRDLAGDADAPVLLPEACDKILAAEGLRRRDGESVVVVCPDRILRVYADINGPPPGDTNALYLQWTFPQLGLEDVDDIEWASINRQWAQGTCGSENNPYACNRHDSEFKLMIAYRTSVGTLNLEMYKFRTSSDAPPSREAIDEPMDRLRMGETDDLKAHPIYLNQGLGGAAVRITDTHQPQLLFEVEDESGDDQLEWRDTVTVATPEKAVYSLLNQQILTGAPILNESDEEIGYKHWLISADSDAGQYNLWSTTPIVTTNRPVAFWDVVQSPHSHTLVKVSPLNESRTEWEFSVSSFQCTDAR